MSNVCIYHTQIAFFSSTSLYIFPSIDSYTFRHNGNLSKITFHCFKTHLFWLSTISFSSSFSYLHLFFDLVAVNYYFQHYYTPCKKLVFSSIKYGNYVGVLTAGQSIVMVGCSFITVSRIIVAIFAATWSST